MKKTDGITLIALIITIIVLLILAGVALATLTGQGNIIENAENAVGKYNNSVKGEQILLNTIEKYLENYTNSGEVEEEDKNNPIVTVTDGEETIEEGADNEISKYFTIDPNGTSPIKTVVYTDTSDGDKEVTNTNTLSVGTHIIKCTVTKETGVSASATKTIVVEAKKPVVIDKEEISNNPKEYFGGYVINYTTPSGDPNVKWRIFYADESNIYLITDNYIHSDYMPNSKSYQLITSGRYVATFGAVYKDYIGASNITDPRISKWINYVKSFQNADNENIRCVAYMLDTDVWGNIYANSDYAEYAVGGPTLELFCASYNKTHTNKFIEYTNNSTGYQLKWNTDNSYSNGIKGVDGYENLYLLSANGASDMWIASPNASHQYYVMASSKGLNEINGWNYSTMIELASTGFRPIVCLNSDVKLEKINGTEYKIVE